MKFKIGDLVAWNLKNGYNCGPGLVLRVAPDLSGEPLRVYYKVYWLQEPARGFGLVREDNLKKYGTSI